MKKAFYHYILSFKDQETAKYNTLDESVICFYEKSKKRLLLSFFIFFPLLFSIDFVSKEYVSKNLKRDVDEKISLKQNEFKVFFDLEQEFFVVKVVDIVPGYFSLVYVRNFDIGFSMLDKIRTFFSTKGFFYFVVGLQSTVLMLLIFLFSRYLFDLFVPFVFIFSGGFSNIFDRFFRGYVVDFFRVTVPYDVTILNSWPIFNFADIFISIGSAYLIYKYFFAKNAVIFSEKEKY